MITTPLSYNEAFEILLGEAKRRPLGTEEIYWSELILGRISSENVFSPENIPPFTNSSVDGFALRTSQTKDHKEFPVLGTIVAGETPPAETKEFGAYEIMTGAPFPEGFDASVKVEDVEVIGDRLNRPFRVILKQGVSPGENVRLAGGDFSIGSPLLHRGTVIEPQHCLALAAVGVSRFTVYKRPKIAIVTTGAELISAGEPSRPGKIRDATGPYLSAALRDMGADFAHYGKVGDDPSQFLSTIKKILSLSPDILITTGAVSMGIHDFVAPCLRDLGGEILFHKVSIRPGKPILFARFDRGPVVFGLPGNPVSTVVGARFFLSPYLRQWMNRPREIPRQIPLSTDIRKPLGLRCFFKAKVVWGKTGASVSLSRGQPSFMVSPLLESNSWAIGLEDREFIPSGECIDVYPFREGVE